MLKKTLSALMVLIIVTLFTLTWYSARQTEHLFAAQIQALNRKTQPFLQLSLDSYQRRLLTSTARTSATTPEGTWILSHQLRHFIWGPQVTTTIVPSAHNRVSNDANSLLKNLRLVTQVDFDGSLKGTVALPDDGVPLAQGKLELSEIIWSWHPQKTVTGSLEFNLPRLRWESAQRRIALHDFTLISSGGGDTALSPRSTIIRFSRFDLGKEQLHQGQLSVESSDIAAATLNETGRLLMDSYQHLNSSQAIPVTTQLAFVKLYKNLLTSGALLRIDPFSVQLATGRMDGAASLQLTPAKDILGALLSLANIDLQLSLSFHRDAFRSCYRLIHQGLNLSKESAVRSKLDVDAEQLMGKWLEEGILTHQEGDGQYRIDFSLTQGLAELNGKNSKLF